MNIMCTLDVVGQKKKICCYSFLFFPLCPSEGEKLKLQGKCLFLSVIPVLCRQGFSLHYHAFWQRGVAISHSNVMWTDN